MQTQLIPVSNSPSSRATSNGHWRASPRSIPDPMVAANPPARRLPHLAAAALLLLTLGLGYIAFSPFGVGLEKPSSSPAAFAPAGTPAAQEATPAGIAWVSVPPGPADPALCQAAPATRARYENLRATPKPLVPADYVGLTGTAADQATIDAVTATMMEYSACVNAGKMLNNANLYTDAGFDEDMRGIDSNSLDFMSSAATPASIEEAYYIFSLTDVRVLSDGRVGAVVTFGEGGKNGTDYLLFAFVGDRYLIDNWVDQYMTQLLPTDATPEAATPAS